uniref:IRS-type PTB domain-containing protein n=1 Tax=Trichuris muris TaxID=70415 RepID=A0A5S6QP84_TRIMR
MVALRMEIFHFDRITWLGRGVGCFAFQLRNGHLFELTSERAEAIARYIQHRASLQPTTRKPNSLRLHYDSSLETLQADEYGAGLPEEDEEDDSSKSVLNSWRKLKATLRNKFKSHKNDDQSSGGSSETEQAELQWLPRHRRRQISRSYSERATTPPAGHLRPNPLYLESIRSSGFFSAESQTDETPITRTQYAYRDESYRKVKTGRNSISELPYTDGQSLGSVITDV